MQKSAHWAYLEGYYPPQIVLLLPVLLSVKHSYNKHRQLQQVKQIGRDVVSSVHLTAWMTYFKIFNTGKSGPDLQFNCVSYKNTWNLNQIIPKVSCTSYYGYAEYLAMGSCSAATGCCSLSVSPGKDYSLTSTDSRGVALQMALLSSAQPAPRSHEQPSRNRAGKPCSSFFFWSTNEIWTFTTSQCFLLLFDPFTTFPVVSDFIVQLWVRNMFSGSYRSIPSSTHTFPNPWSLVTAGADLKHSSPPNNL